MNKTKSKLWTKDFIIFSSTNFFIFLTFYLLMTTLTVYAIDEFRASQSKAGLASSIFVIGACASRLFAGKFIEIIGRKKLLFGGLFLFLLATLFYFTVENLNLLLVTRFIHGAAFGVATTAMITTVMEIIPNERRGEGTSYFSLSTTLATAVGPFLGVFMSQHANFDMIFIVCTLFSVLSIVISLFAKVPKANITKAQLDAMRGFKWKDFFEVKAVPIAIIASILAFTYSSILTFLASYTVEIDLTAAASFFFIVYAAFILISRPFTGRLLDLKGENIVLYPAILFFMISLVVLGFAHNGFTLLLAGALMGLGYGSITSATQAIAVNESPRHRIGLATSTFFIFIDGGMGLGPFLLGYIIPLTGYRGLYETLAIVVLASIFLYYFLHGKKKSYKNQHSLAS